MIDKIKYRLFRNQYGVKNVPSQKNRVNIEYSKTVNVGDSLSPVVVNWMLEKKNIDPMKAVKNTKHLFAIGSVIARGGFDASIWGTGILREDIQVKIEKQKNYRKYDIRAVRGPITRKILLEEGYECPEVYGDPAVLAPIFYQPEKQEKKYKVSIILHHLTSAANKDDNGQKKIEVPEGLHIIDPVTTDYKQFINEIVSSEYVISSSLHGIILAEVYGIPAIFLKWGIEDQSMKYDDWYLSTGRETVFVTSIQEALEATPMQLPDLSDMQKKLMETFPYDLWE